VGVAVGAGDEAEVRRITGGAPPEFPPKLSTLPGALLGTEQGGFEPLADEINPEACSGERVVVVGGRVSGSGVVVADADDDVPLFP